MNKNFDFIEYPNLCLFRGNYEQIFFSKNENRGKLPKVHSNKCRIYKYEDKIIFGDLRMNNQLAYTMHCSALQHTAMTFPNEICANKMTLYIFPKREL